MIHEFRHPDLVEVLPIRNLIRGQHPDFPMPSSSDGLVVNDIDLVIKWHGRQFGRYGQRTRFVEVKNDNAALSCGQVHQYADIDYRMSKVMPDGYDGFFQVNFDHNATVEVKCDNGKVLEFPDSEVIFTVMGDRVEKMNMGEFLQWINEPFSPFPGMGESDEFKRIVAKLYGTG